jgi:predicted small secreted protein
MIHSNVTFGLQSLPHVDSKVTACHAMRGSGSAGNDIRDGGTILELAMDDDDHDLSTVQEPLPPLEIKGFQHSHQHW